MNFAEKYLAAADGEVPLRTSPSAARSIRGDNYPDTGLLAGLKGMAYIPRMVSPEGENKFCKTLCDLMGNRHYIFCQG
jgi:hypothetical protein